MGVFCTVVSAFADHGAGELKTPGRQFYVSLKGDDKNDGKTPATAWKTLERGVKNLKAGDILHVAEGLYRTGMGASLRRQPDYCTIYGSGKPGSPIIIKGAGRGKTVLSGAKYYKNPHRIGKNRTMQYKLEYPPLYDLVWEHPSQIKLQKVRYPEIVQEYPGTYHYDAGKKILTVHFVAMDQTGVNVSYDRIGLAVSGSYVSIEDMTFTHYCEAVFARQTGGGKDVVSNFTVKNCGFFHNYETGIKLWNMKKALIAGNQAMSNGTYGSILIRKNCHDTLITGNWVGPSPETWREQEPYIHGFGIQRYAGNDGGPSCIIGNVMDDKLSFRWKSKADPGSRFEDNIVTGFFYAESILVPVSIQRNLFTGRIKWQRLGDYLREKDFAGTPVVFKNNVKNIKDFKPENKNAFEALKLALPQPKITIPWCHFTQIAVKYVDKESAVIEFQTVRNDGWGSVIYRPRGEKRWKTVKSLRQGIRHVMALTGLQADTEYEYQLLFLGRRGEKGRGKVLTFKTERNNRAPMTIVVEPGRNLEEAAQKARPGDTVLLRSGRHYGHFVPVCSGLPDKKITLKGEKGAVIDGMFFYGPLVDLSGKSNWIVDGITFDNPEETSRKGLIRMAGSKDMIVRNCKSAGNFSFMSGPFIYGHGNRFTIENNVVWGGSYQFQLIGNDHVICRNTMVNGTFYHFFAANANNITITDNIFYRPCVPEKKNPAYLLQNIRGKIISDRNVYFSPYKHQPAGGQIRNSNEKTLVLSKDLAHWQKVTGFDRNSIAADPCFLNVEKGDFRLNDMSPAKGKGADLK